MHHSKRIFGLVSFFSFSLVLLCGGVVSAIAADSEPLPAEYTVQSGDTLSKIAARFLGDPDKWYILMKFNDIDDPDKIYPGTKLKMSDTLVQGKIIAGHVIFVTKDQASYEVDGTSQVLEEGDEIPPDGKVTTRDGIVTIKLPDDSIVQLFANTTLKITDLFMNETDKTQYSFFELLSGKVRAKVTRLMRGSKFEVKAKTSIAGVRGTEFEILVDDSNQIQFATFEGSVAVKSLKTGKSIELQAGQAVAMNRETDTLSGVRPLLSAPDNVGYRENPDGSITFVWDAVPGAQAYAFYVAQDPRFERNQLAGMLNQTSVTFSKFPPGRAYVRVDAIDSDGLASMPIKPLMVLPD